MGEKEKKVATITELLAAENAKTLQTPKALSEISGFRETHQIDNETTLGGIFAPETASEFLARIINLEGFLSESDSYEKILEKIQKRIDEAETLRDELMARLYEQLRPVEASYRQIQLFFENSVVTDGKELPPVELFIFNADPATMLERHSLTLEAIRRFVKNRNDNFNFRDDISYLAVPGIIPMMVRDALEEEARKWGMLLITDLYDEKSLDDVERQFRPGGRYEFLKRSDNQAASDVVMIGHLKLRDDHWFEKDATDLEGLYAPASLTFAGALARTDRTRDSSIRGLIGTKFGQVKGVENARIECLISQMETFALEMQVISFIRDADNHLCFYGCRCLADDLYGVYKFFIEYRVLSFLEKVLTDNLREFYGKMLTKDLVNENIEKSIESILIEFKEQGIIFEYEFIIDKCYDKIKEGICGIQFEIMPMGGTEVFRMKLHFPEFKPYN